MDALLLPQSSDDLSSRVDSRRNGSFDGYAGSREASSLTVTHSSRAHHSFTYGQQQQQSHSTGAVNPFQAHQAAAARAGMRGFGSSDNLAGLGLPGHQRAGEKHSWLPLKRCRPLSHDAAHSLCLLKAAVPCQQAHSLYVNLVNVGRCPLSPVPAPAQATIPAGHCTTPTR